MTQVIDLAIPVQSIPKAKDIISNPARFKMLNWHRKARKTTLAISNLIRYAATFNHVYWYVSPSYSAAKRTVWDDPEILPRLLPGWADDTATWFKKNETELRIYFPKSGGSIYFIGADRPDLMRGPNPWGVVHDEFSVQRKEVWQDVVQPILLANPNAFAWFLFTPRGKNHAYDLMLQHESDPNWQISTVNCYQSGIFTPEQIEEMKAQMIPASFQQEFMCEFLEGEGSVFRHVKEVCNAQVKEPIPGHLYVMGVDLGKSQDYTVITVYDRKTNYQVYQERFNILEWPFQRAKIAHVSGKYNNALTVLDTTGIGGPIYDDLSRLGVPIQPFSFTNTSKKEIIEKLSIYIEQKYIRMIPTQETLTEFDSYEIEYTPTGLVTYNARSGMHDDIVIAQALAVSQLHPIAKRDMIETEPSRLQEYFKTITKPKDPEEMFAEWANPEYEYD